MHESRSDMRHSAPVCPPQRETAAATPDHHRTPHDKLDAVAEERLGRPFDELSGREKQSVGGAVGGAVGGKAR
jgi:hypothetical protein